MQPHDDGTGSSLTCCTSIVSSGGLLLFTRDNPSFNLSGRDLCIAALVAAAAGGGVLFLSTTQSHSSATLITTMWNKRDIT